MHLNLASFSILVTICNGLSIEKVSVDHQNVIITGDTYKDKHGSAEIGKHEAIATKKKVKKRLASPLNYKVSAFEDNDDYYEKGGGESDNNSEGNYESKDWSDLNREPVDSKNKNSASQIPDLTNIEGIDVIKKESKDFQSPKIVVKNEVMQKLFDSEEEDDKQNGNPLIAIYTTDKNKVSTKRANNSDEFNDYYDIHKTEKGHHTPDKTIENKLKRPKDNQDISYYDESSKQDENSYTKSRNVATTTDRTQAKRRKIKTSYPLNDYYDNVRSDVEPTREERENEMRKIKILDAVDDLKERHAQESKLISEKFKEEELQREEFERNNAPRTLDKYRQSPQHKARGKSMNDYEEYEEHPNFHDKYKPEPVSKIRTTAKSTKATSTEKPNEYRKMSVFKSPHLYLSYDDADERTEHTTKKVDRLITVAENTDERISLIPEEAKEGEPTLFMPKKFYKNKRKDEKDKKHNNNPEDYIPQSKYSPNKNIRATTLAMITDNYFPTTDISFTMATEPLNSFARKTEPEEQESGPESTEYNRYKITEDLIPQRTTTTDYYTEKTLGDSYDTEKTNENRDYTEKTYENRDYSEKTNENSDYTEKSKEYRDYTEKNFVDGELDMSGVGSDFNSMTTNENFDENSTEIYDKVEAKHPVIEPEISLAQTEETTAFSSDSGKDLSLPTIIIQVDDSAPQSSNYQNEDYKNGKEGGGRRHNSEHDQEYKEQGKKHYENVKEEEILGKGYHNSKKDVNKYDSNEQAKEVYSDDSGHSARHDHVEAGKKHAEYEETGKHSKGHSTKGSHDVHKKEEYEKKEEFFEYSGDEEDKRKKNRAIKSYDQRSILKEVALNSKPRRAYASSDAYQAQIRKPTTRNNTKEKWIYHHGYPPRSNNLRLIDRRLDSNHYWPHSG